MILSEKSATFRDHAPAFSWGRPETGAGAPDGLSIFVGHAEVADRVDAAFDVLLCAGCHGAVDRRTFRRRVGDRMPGAALAARQGTPLLLLINLPDALLVGIGNLGFSGQHERIDRAP